MHVVVLGSLGGALLAAAQMATARGAKLWHVDTAEGALALLRRDAKADLLLVELDRKLGEAIDIYVNNRLVARGEVVMVDDTRLGVTMTEIVKTERTA